MASYNGTDSSQCVSEEYLLELKRKVGKEWKDVGRCLGFSNAELDYLEEDNKNNVEEAIYQMLLSWKSKNGVTATYASLEEAMVRSKGQILPEDSPSHTSDKRELLISYLKKTYEKWLRTVRPNPMKKAQKWKLKDLFMDLGFALLDQTYSSNEQGSWKSLKTYTALFEHPELSEEGSKIIIEGDPGSGKTTLMHYLAYLWCNNDKIMEGVKLFILLPLRRVKPGTSIDKVVMDVLLGASRGELTDTDIQCVLRNERCMILALDGLDEYSGLNKEEHEETPIMAIVKGESEYVSPEVKVILTTRPSSLPYIHDCHVKRVKLQRLQYIHAETYLKKVFPREEDEAKRRLILETIDANYFIKDYCGLPLWFTLIVHIMRDDLQSNKEIKLTCLTDFFKYILRSLRGHLVNKNRPDLRDFESPKLAEIAFNGLLQSSLKQIWNKEDLATVENYNKLVEIGILVEEEDLDSDSMYSDANMAPKTVTFLHKTFQEWYGAMYLAELSNTPDIFTQRLDQIMNFRNFNLLYFTCGISPQATKRILNFCLSNGRAISSYNLIFRCILEYNGEECDLKEPLSQLCQMKKDVKNQCIFTLSGGDETLLLKSKLAILRVAHKFEIIVKHVDLPCGDLTCAAPDKIIVMRNIEMPPLSAEVITVYKCYGQPFFNFLMKCDNLEELRLSTETFPGAPQEIRRRLSGKKIKVLWLLHQVDIGKYQQSYEMQDDEWQFLTGRYCGNCYQSMRGIFWECRTCPEFYLCQNCMDQGHYEIQSHLFERIEWSMTSRHCGHCDQAIQGSFWERKKFYLCDVCKDQGYHAHHSHRLGREFDERKQERYKILCSGCKVADVTTDGFECETCVNFNLCEVCKDEYPHNHQLKQRIYHVLKRCFRCIGKEWCRPDFEGKRYRGYGLCEDCWYRTAHLWPRELSVKNSFKPRCCESYSYIRPVNKVWFRCNTCPSVILCEPCKDRGIHGEHSFHRQYYIDVYCEECGTPAVLMYRCNTCQGSFRCIICQARCKSRRHEIDKVEDTELIDTAHDRWKISTLLPRTPAIHKEFQLRRCKNCKVPDEINKVWFLCDTCPYFLLCGQCKDGGVHREHKFSRQNFCDVTCTTCGIPVILMYRCKTCFGVILCIICQAMWIHKRHVIEEIKEIPVHHEGFICSCCGHRIFGTRYKCMSCKNYNICEFCKAMDVHSEPHSVEKEHKKATFTCNHCYKERCGPSFKCKQCSSFRLCEDCNSKGIHRNHEFREIHEKEVHHIGVKCTKCDNDVYGSRFRCTTCSGYNICQDCNRIGRHSEHKLIEITQAELYHDMTCVRCHAGIHGICYKCKKCKKYNICKYCITEDICRGHNLLVEMSKFPFGGCSRCKGGTFGPRIFCESCRSYSLCEECKRIATNEKSCKHEFVELQMKDVQHKYIHCSLCKEYQFRGTRYRCKICKWYNLCEYCKQTGHHKHHEFEEWKTSQFLPGPAELPYIYGAYTQTDLEKPVEY